MTKRSTLKNITLSADETLITKARERALLEERTLNEAFREWLEQFTRPLSDTNDYKSFMNKLSHARSGKKFSRDEMNER